MRNNDLLQIDELVNLSHASLKDDFEVSSDPSNLIVSLPQEFLGCLCARIMGAGFGGCVLALFAYLPCSRKGWRTPLPVRLGLYLGEKLGLNPSFSRCEAALAYVTSVIL